MVREYHTVKVAFYGLFFTTATDAATTRVSATPTTRVVRTLAHRALAVGRRRRARGQERAVEFALRQLARYQVSDCDLLHLQTLFD